MPKARVKLRESLALQGTYMHFQSTEYLCNLRKNSRLETLGRSPSTLLPCLGVFNSDSCLDLRSNPHKL